MTDIVEKLRNKTECLGHGDYAVDSVSLEAADEIERLRETTAFLDKQVVQNDWRILSLLRILAAHGIEVDK